MFRSQYSPFNLQVALQPNAHEGRLQHPTQLFQCSFPHSTINTNFRSILNVWQLFRFIHSKFQHELFGTSSDKYLIRSNTTLEAENLLDKLELRKGK